MIEDGRTCHAVAGITCPAVPCPGLSDPGPCAQLAALAKWRGMSHEEQLAALGTPPPLIDPAVRDAVNACPARGPVLPLSMQDDCGCRGKELSGCREGKGAIPGRVTLRDCLACQGSDGSPETRRLRKSPLSQPRGEGIARERDPDDPSETDGPGTPRELVRGNSLPWPAFPRLARRLIS